VAVWSVESAWLKYENGQGTVLGNVTTQGSGGKEKREVVREKGHRAMKFSA